MPFHQLAGDEHVLDVTRIHQRHNRPWHVVQREVVDAVSRQHDDIGLLPRA